MRAYADKKQKTRSACSRAATGAVNTGGQFRQFSKFLFQRPEHMLTLDTFYRPRCPFCHSKRSCDRAERHQCSSNALPGAKQVSFGSRRQRNCVKIFCFDSSLLISMYSEYRGQRHWKEGIHPATFPYMLPAATVLSAHRLPKLGGYVWGGRYMLHATISDIGRASVTQDDEA